MRDGVLEVIACHHRASVRAVERGDDWIRFPSPGIGSRQPLSPVEMYSLWLGLFFLDVPPHRRNSRYDRRRELREPSPQTCSRGRYPRGSWEIACRSRQESRARSRAPKMKAGAPSLRGRSPSRDVITDGAGHGEDGWPIRSCAQLSLCRPRNPAIFNECPSRIYQCLMLPVLTASDTSNGEARIQT